MATMPYIRTEDIAGTAVIWLSRPPVNALDAEMVRELRDVFEGYTTDPPARGLVLAHDGPVFCGGVDVKAVPTYSSDRRRSMADDINVMITALYGLPSPTVAAVNGHAIGAGFVLLLACDVRLAVDADFKLALTEVTAGVPYPAGPLEVVHAELDPNQQRTLVLTGDAITPAEAHHRGIIDETPTSEVLLLRAIELARIRSDASAYRVIKQQLRGPVLERMRTIVDRPHPEAW